MARMCRSMTTTSGAWWKEPSSVDLSSTQKSATYAKTKSPSLGIYTPRTGFALIQPKFKASRVCQSLRTKKTCRDSLAWWRICRCLSQISAKNHNHWGSCWKQTFHLSCQRTSSTASTTSKSWCHQPYTSSSLARRNQLCWRLTVPWKAWEQPSFRMDTQSPSHPSHLTPLKATTQTLTVRCLRWSLGLHSSTRTSTGDHSRWSRITNRLRWLCRSHFSKPSHSPPPPPPPPPHPTSTAYATKDPGVWLRGGIPQREIHDPRRHPIQTSIPGGQDIPWPRPPCRRPRPLQGQDWLLSIRLHQLHTQETVPAAWSHQDWPRAEQPDGDHSAWMARQHQSTPRRRQTILVIQRRACNRRWNHLQRTGSHCTRGSPAGCAEATPSISPRPRKDATTGQRMRILAKHLQRHWASSHVMRNLPRICERKQPWASSSSWHSQQPSEKTRNRPFWDWRSQLSPDCGLLLKVPYCDPDENHDQPSHSGGSKEGHRHVRSAWPDHQWQRSSVPRPAFQGTHGQIWHRAHHLVPQIPTIKQLHWAPGANGQEDHQEMWQGRKRFSAPVDSKLHPPPKCFSATLKPLSCPRG